MSLSKSIEKTPMQSKKFLAYLFANLINKVLIFWMIQKGIGGTTIAWAITAAAFIDIGYILGQAALDGFVRMAHVKNPIEKEDKKNESNLEKESAD
jgi:hypothetical protein